MEGDCIVILEKDLKKIGFKLSYIHTSWTLFFPQQLKPWLSSVSSDL